MGQIIENCVTKKKKKTVLRFNTTLNERLWTRSVFVMASLQQQDPDIPQTVQTVKYLRWQADPPFSALLNGTV